MSPIVTIQKRMTEVGRIRMGEKVAAGRGSRPSRLDHFRLTSHDKRVIESAAAVYGGEVKPWQSEAGAQWQLIIEADALDVLIAPGEAFSQWFELWTGGGCARRCNGLQVETLDGKDVRDREVDCMCPHDVAERVDMAAAGAACKPTTRLSVWLPRLAGIGVWRAETHGFYAAAELPNVVGLLQGMAAQGYRPPAILRIGTRSVKRPNQPTKTFPVLELDVPEVTLSGILSAGVSLAGEGLVIGPGTAAQIAAGGNVKQLAPGAEFTEPPTGTVPSPRQRVPRPPNGTPVDLPAGSDMRKPAATMPAARVEPTVGGFAVDDDPGPGDPDTGATADPITAESVDADTGEQATADLDNGLTPAQFIAMAKSHQLGNGQIVREAKRLFPDVPQLSALTDDQRGELLDSLTAATTTAG